MKKTISGIRGIFGEDLNLKDIIEFSNNFSSLIKSQKCVVGRDTRPSGKMIQVDNFTGSILFYQNLHLGNINLLSIKENYLLFNQVNGKVVIFKQ